MGENLATFHLEPGTVIAGRYEVCNKIGAGGMGMVFRALDRELNNDVVALKLLLPHLASDQAVFRRFLNEVLVARSLSHPNIVRLHDIGKAEAGFHYISMEYVDGYSLKDRLMENTADEPTGTNFSPLTFDECIAILYRIASGVAYAHEKGVIHRDLKPANVLISKKGEVKLADFGTARIVGMDTSLTQTGQMIGTPDYMSPEQIRGETLDSACDIYSLGIIAYELVTGRRPFAADSAVAVAFKHLSEPLPELSGVTASKTPIPDWYPALVKKATAKDKKDRFPSGLEFISALAERIPDSAKHTGFFSASRTGFFVSAPTKGPTEQIFELGAAPTASSSGEWKLGAKDGGTAISPPAAPPKRNFFWLILFPLLLAGAGVFGYLQYEKSKAGGLTSPPARNKLEEELISSLGGGKNTTVTPGTVTPGTVTPGTVTTVASAVVVPVTTVPTLTELTIAPTTITTVTTAPVITVPVTTVTVTTGTIPPPTVPVTTIPVQHVSAVDLAFQVGGQTVRTVEQFNVANVTWSALVHGVTAHGESRDFIANLFSERKKRVIGKLNPRSVSPVADQTVRLKGGLADVTDDIAPGEYRLDLLYRGEFLLASKFTVLRPPEPETPQQTPTTVPSIPPVGSPTTLPPSTLPSGLPPAVRGGSAMDTTPTPVVTPDTIPPAPVNEQYGGSIDLIETEGAPPMTRHLTLDLIFVGDDVSGSAEIEGVGSFSVKGNVLARGMNLNLWSEKIALRLTSGKPGGKLRGNYTVSNQRINGRWEAGRR